MKRPLFWMGIVFLTATAVFLLCPPSFGIAAAVLFAALSFVLQGKRNTVLMLAAVIIAFSSVSLHRTIYDRRLNSFSDGVVGTMVVSQVKNYSGRFVYSGKATVTNGEDTFTVPVSLSMWGESDASAGDVLSFSASLYRRRNEASLLGEEISLTYTGECENAPAVPRLPLILTRMRLAVCDAASEMLFGDEFGVFCAVFAGDDSMLDYEVEDAFRKSGISHLLVVSGMHLCVVSSLVSRMLHKMKRKHKFLLITTAVWAFAAFTGFGLSVLRAAVMVTLLEIAGLFHRQGDTLTSLSFAGILIVLFSPAAVLSASFLLSFSAVFGIAVYAEPLERLFDRGGDDNSAVSRYLISPLCVSAAAQLGTMPVAALFFGSVPFLGIFANLPAIPLLLPILVFGGLGVLFSFLRGICGFICQTILGLLCFIAEVFSSLPLVRISVSERYLLVGLLGFSLMAALCAFIKPRAVLMRVGALSLAVCILFCTAVSLLVNKSAVTVCDMSEYGSVVFTRGSCAVIVGAPDSGYGASRIKEYLEAQSVSHIEAVYADDDVLSGSVYSLCEGFSVGGMLVPATDANRAFCSAAGFTLYDINKPSVMFGEYPVTFDGEKFTVSINDNGKPLCPNPGICVIIEEYIHALPAPDGGAWRVRLSRRTA